MRPSRFDRMSNIPALLSCIVLGAGLAAAGGCMPQEEAADGSGGRTGTGGSPSVGTGGGSVSPGTGGAGTGGAGPLGTGGSGTGGSGSGGRSGGTGGVSAGSGGSSGGTGGQGPGTGGRGGGGTAGGAGGRVGSGGMAGTGSGGAGGALPRFSFFVTSLEAMRRLSNNMNGFGGDLRFGETTGLAGADKICREIAKMAMPGAEAKTWRAFLSATTGGTNGGPVNAIDRIGTGPWYDRMGRLIAMSKADLMQTRPRGADAAIANDLPNELGIPNRQGVDNHDTLTGSNTQGMLMSTSPGSTCNDWTSAVGSTGKPMLGHSWPAGSGMSWIQAHAAAGCAPSVHLEQTGPPAPGTDGVGSGGGYGGIYCFALTP